MTVKSKEVPLPWMTHLAKAIKRGRLHKQWSQEQLALEVDSTCQQISNYENGKTTPSLTAVRRIAEALGLSIDHMLARGGVSASIEAQEE